MRIIPAQAVTDAVRELCIRSNCELPPDLCRALATAADTEPWPPAAALLRQLDENQQVARREGRPICQDTGLACVFVTIGQQVQVEGGLTEAIHEGVRRGYGEGYLRKSAVADPLRRKNTGDNTPAMITYDIVPGDQLTIVLAPKGFGSENKSQIRMLRPSDGEAGVKDFIVQVCREAGPDPCPPIVVGVGLGGTFDKAALLAKQALLIPAGQHNPDPYYAAMEEELTERINGLGIGPQGFGGRTTTLGVHILTMPTHIAGLPCAVNISCHVTRHVQTTL